MRAAEQPTVSVGLAVRNEPQAVRRCVESVLGQDFTDLELVIADNASDDAKYAPVYGVDRRAQLMRTGRVRPNERTDWLLVAELALMAPIIHVDELLAHRTRTYPAGVDRAAFRRRLDPVHGERLKTS